MRPIIYPSTSPLLCLTSAVLFGGLVTAQEPSFAINPVTNFCGRWWSQSVVKDNVLYIDSGAQKWNGTDVHDLSYGINNYLLKIPLNTTWDWKTNIVINAEPKNKSNPATGTRPPSLMRGHLYHGPSDDSNIFLYGGTTYMQNQSFPTFTRPDASTYPLWTYNHRNPDSPWKQYDIDQPWMANHGAAAEAIDQGLGFYLNGQIDWGTSSSTLNNLQATTDYRPLDGMLVIDFHDYTSNNISTSDVRGGAPRVGGSMEYLASVGGMGVLVTLGGQLTHDEPWANLSAADGKLLDFSVVDVFDIDSYLQNPSNNGTWYQQNTTGSVPKPRVNFCTVVTSAPDNSSHHIYLYAGNDPTIHKNNDPYNNYTSYDDVYVLTIPSFEWTAVYTDGASPRWGHNCHRAGKRQMVTVGGNITNSGDCDWELKGVAFLDLTTVTWGSVFQANSSDYQVAQKLLPATGGTPMGGATKKEPKTGWTDPGLKSVFDTPRKSNSYHAPKSTPTATPAPNPGSHTGAIAGGVVGGVVGLALLAGLLFFLYRRRSKNPAELENHEVQRRELDQEQNKFELPGINENDPAELPGPEVVELNAPRQFVEAGGITTTRAAELSANESGIPQVRTPGDDLPIPPAYTPGLQRPAKARRRSLSPTPRGATTKTPKKSREVQEEGPAFETPRRQSE